MKFKTIYEVLANKVSNVWLFLFTIILLTKILFLDELSSYDMKNNNIVLSEITSNICYKLGTK